MLLLIQSLFYSVLLFRIFFTLSIKFLNPITILYFQKNFFEVFLVRFGRALYLCFQRQTEPCTCAAKTSAMFQSSKRRIALFLCCQRQGPVLVLQETAHCTREAGDMSLYLICQWQGPGLVLQETGPSTRASRDRGLYMFLSSKRQRPLLVLPGQGHVKY